MRVKAIHVVRLPGKKGFVDMQPGEEFDLRKEDAEELIGMGAVVPAVAKTKAKADEKPAEKSKGADTKGAKAAPGKGAEGEDLLD